MTVHLSITRFDDEVFDRIEELFSKEFEPKNRLLSFGYSRWLYKENPNGAAEIVTAVTGDALIGFMAMIPAKLLRGSVTMNAYYIVNVLVDRAYRGKKIFGRMIELAEERCRNKRALLLGHPNSAAEGAWRRAGMRFFKPRRAYLSAPVTTFFDNYTSNWIDDASQLATFLDLYNQGPTISTFRILLSEDYLLWRYLRHPTTRYRLQLISSRAAPIGLIITKPLRPGLNMMVDHFYLTDISRKSLAKAPWLTVAFLSEDLAKIVPHLAPNPIRKEISFFCTGYDAILQESDVRDIGLSLSDF